MKKIDLERRIGILEDIEAIEKLKARYWYCIERKLWDDLADLFTEDVIDYLGNVALKGKENVVNHLVERLNLGRNVHQGHSPIIEFTSDTTATAKWALNDYNEFDPQALTGFEGWGSYEDEYVKEEGKLEIKSWKRTCLRAEWWNKTPEPLFLINEIVGISIYKVR